MVKKSYTPSEDKSRYIICGGYIILLLLLLLLLYIFDTGNTHAGDRGG